MSTTYVMACNKKSGHQARFFTRDLQILYAFAGGLSNKAARINPTAARTAVG